MHKISGTHRKAFLSLLAATGNYTLAAERLLISKDWAYKLRRRDAAFDAECRAAMAAARERLNGAPAPADERWEVAAMLGPASGKAGRPLVLQRGRGRRAQVKRARPDQWTHETAERFLTALAGTCNVSMAAAAVGTSATSAHARRRMDPGFARAWAEALDLGYARIETAMIEAAACFFEGEVIPDDNPIRSMSVAEAIQSLNMNKFAVKGAGKGRPGRHYPVEAES